MQDIKYSPRAMKIYFSEVDEEEKNEVGEEGIIASLK
jgi:hypothetical protein